MPVVVAFAQHQRVAVALANGRHAGRPFVRGYRVAALDVGRLQRCKVDHTQRAVVATVAAPNVDTHDVRTAMVGRLELSHGSVEPSLVDGVQVGGVKPRRLAR